MIARQLSKRPLSLPASRAGARCSDEHDLRREPQRFTRRTFPRGGYSYNSPPRECPGCGAAARVLYITRVATMLVAFVCGAVVLLKLRRREVQRGGWARRRLPRPCTEVLRVCGYRGWTRPSALLSEEE